MATKGEIGIVAAVAATAAVAAVGAGVVGRRISGPGISATDAARFLTQCTFGVTEADIAAVQSAGYVGWLDQQMAMAPFSTLAFMNTRTPQSKPYRVEAHGAFVESFWTGAITRPDQLRQRMQFALSQIFVLSRENETLEYDGAFGTGNYYDLLAKGAFGNFRDLLNDVTFNAMTGIFLSYVHNDPEDPATGRTPDENFARESMQLFTLGTVLLNQDGTPKHDAQGAPIPTYTHNDIAGLAKVFTGMSWGSGNPKADDQYLSTPNGYLPPMIFYPSHHSLSQKQFLGVTIPASTISNGPAEVKTALDTLFHHANTAPYLSKRLIQQFVTSNPSPAFVTRVANTFDDNGHGVRGDLNAVLRAILLDAEARDALAAQADPNFGKLREPVIRLTNWARSFNAQSKKGLFEIGETGDPTSLNQAVMDAPSVFNFWRAGYVPPHTALAAAGKVSPEFQVVTELTTAAYVNLIQGAVSGGIGLTPPNNTAVDVSSTYASEIAVAQDAAALADRLNLLLFYGQMSPGLRARIVAAVNTIKIPTSGSTTAALTNRSKLAVLLSMASAEYLTQR